MTPEDVRDIFEPFAPVTTRKMFGGLGIYCDGQIFAIVADGEVFVKADDLTRPSLEAAGSEPFVFESAKGSATMSYWRLPAEAYDDPDALCRYAQLALDAAKRKPTKPHRYAKP